VKLLRLCTVYPDYLKSFYGKRPGLAGESFQEQDEAIMYDAFGWADFWKNPLKSMGYETADVVANAESLQRAWAEESGIKQPGKDWLERLALARIEKFKPDILFINDYVTFKRSWIDTVRSSCPSIKLVLGWCGAPFPDVEVFRGYDAVLSCVPELVETFQHMGHRSYHLNHAFDPKVLDRISGAEKVPHDFTFVGQINRQSGFHLDREKILLYLAGRTPLTIFSISSRPGPAKHFMAFLRKGVHSMHSGLSRLGVPEDLLSCIPLVSRGPRYSDHPFLPVHPLLGRHLRPGVFGLDMFRVLRDSSVTFNRHLNISVHSSSNMRMFEATGVGTCLLTDHMERTARLFEPDYEVVTYRSAEECAEKALYLLEHPAQRGEIALAGQRRALKDHNYDLRAGDLDRIIKKELGGY
jgi:hypothetical protein